MPWPTACASCKSMDVQVGAHEITCLKCGRLTDKHGNPVSLDEQNLAADEYLLKKLADLQAQLENN